MFIDVKFKHTSNAYLAGQWLKDLPDTIGVDFECASRYSDIEKELLKIQYEGTETNITGILESDGLSHPELARVTHLAIGLTPSEGLVLVCDNKNILTLVYNFLVTTEVTQIWFNAPFDFKHIYYNTGKIPKNWVDAQLRKKCRINNADNQKALVGLKQVQGHYYGDWGIAKELEFNLKNMYDPVMLKYAATDACATLHEYELQENKTPTDYSSIIF